MEYPPNPTTMRKRKISLLIICLVSLLVIIFVFKLIISNSHTVNRSTHSLTLTIPKNAKYVPDRLLVKFKKGRTPEDISNAEYTQLHNIYSKAGVISQNKVYPNNDPVLRTYFILDFKKGTNLQDATKQLSASDFIESVEVDEIIHVEATPNDQYYQQDQWNLRKISMPAAWDISEGSNAIIVGIIDTGVDYKNPDLPTNIIRGPDYFNGDNDPMDDYGHGTHVSGIIGALTNNTIGVSGVNWNVRMLDIKTMDSNGDGTTTTISKGITYATDNGARIINLSLGAPGSCASGSVASAINYAEQKNVLIVAAAGNENSSVANTQPANCPGVLAVGATDSNDKRAVFSNYGSQIKISAPGVNILSTKSSICNTTLCRSIVGTNYVYLSGTSMATPHVSGVAALLLAANNTLTPQQIVNCIITGGDPIATDLPIGGKRLNAQKALTLCGGVTPTIYPTSIPTIMPTIPVGGGTELQLTGIRLHGIGIGGDNSNPNSTGTQMPIHSTRNIDITLTDQNNIALPIRQGSITYNAASGTFQGIIPIGTIVSGLYRMNVKIADYLPKTISSIVSLTNGYVTTINQIALTTGDATGDGLLNVQDYNVLLDCISGLTIPKNCADPAKKQSADFNDDGNVDQFDYNLFIRELSVQNGQ